MHLIRFGSAPDPAGGAEALPQNELRVLTSNGTEGRGREGPEGKGRKEGKGN